MKHSRAYIIIGVLAVLLLASCGQRHQAKGLVKDFVKAYATEEIDINSFSDLDSTKVISDSLILALRDKAKSDPVFQKDFQLADKPENPTLLFIRMRFQLPGDTLEQSRTFYFDRDLTGIVAFK